MKHVILAFLLMLLMHLAWSQPIIQATGGVCNTPKIAVNMDGGYNTEYVTVTVGFISPVTDLSRVPMLFTGKASVNIELGDWQISPAVGAAYHAFSTTYKDRRATHAIYQLNVYSPAWEFDPNTRWLFSAATSGSFNYIGVGFSSCIKRK